MPAAPGGPAEGLLVGQIVAGRYTCLGPLGQDLLGPLYRAQRTDGVPCILQLLRVPLPEGPVVRRELERDLRTAASLRHPGLGGPVELVVDEGVGYLVREAMPGQTLEAHLQRLGRPPVEAAFDILERVAGALRVAHRSGLLHLHLSPARVFLQQSPRGFLVRLLDVGLWRLVRPEQHAGTLVPARYVAPEQVVTPRSADARTDVYGLGLLLFELLSGRPPFSSHDPDVLMAQHVNDAPPTLTDRAPDRLFSAELENLVASALAKSPQDRPRDAGVLLERLHQLRQQGDLVLSLDEGEADLPPDWRIAGLSEAEVLLATAVPPEADLPAPAGSRAAVGTRSRPPPPRPGSVLENRPGPGGVGAEVVSRGGPQNEVLVAPAPSPDAASPGAEQGLPDLPSVEAMPPLQADELAALQLPEEPPQAPAQPEPQDRSWLRRPVRVLGVRIPRVALLGGGLGCLLGLVALVTTWMGPEVPATDRARPPRAQSGLSGAAARRPAPPPAAIARSQDPPRPAPLLEGERRTAPSGPDTAPPGRISLTLALGEPLRLPAPSRAASARRLTSHPSPPAEPPTRAAEPRPQDRGRTPGGEARQPGRHGEERQPAPATEAEPRRVRPGSSAVTVRILSAPLGAQVMRDGQVLGTTPFSEALRRTNRPVVYEISRPGYERTRVEVMPNQDRMLQVELSPNMSLKEP